MPRIGLGLLILLVAAGLPGRGMAKGTASMSRGTHVFDEYENLLADEQCPTLTVGELFSTGVLPEISFFDGPEQCCIVVEWISIAEILDETSGKSRPVIEPDQGEFNEVSFASLELSIMDMFVMASPYELMTGCDEMSLLKAGAWQMIGF